MDQDGQDRRPCHDEWPPAVHPEDQPAEKESLEDILYRGVHIDVADQPVVIGSVDHQLAQNQRRRGETLRMPAFQPTDDRSRKKSDDQGKNEGRRIGQGRGNAGLSN